MWYIWVELAARIGLPAIFGLSDLMVDGAPFSYMADAGLTVSYDGNVDAGPDGK
jgi:hypothetical protein